MVDGRADVESRWERVGVVMMQLQEVEVVVVLVLVLVLLLSLGDGIEPVMGVLLKRGRCAGGSTNASARTSTTTTTGSDTSTSASASASASTRVRDGPQKRPQVRHLRLEQVHHGDRKQREEAREGEERRGPTEPGRIPSNLGCRAGPSARRIGSPGRG